MSRSIFALVDDRDQDIGYIDENTRAIVGPSYAAEPMHTDIRRHEYSQKLSW